MSVDIGAIVQGGTGMGEIVAGMLIQDETSDKIKELRKKYPNMSIPEAIVQATDLYRQDAQRTRMPGQDLYEQQIQQSTAQGISQSREAATSAADLLGATTSLYGQQSQAMTQLQIEAARQQAQSRQLYGQQLNTLGSWQHQEYLTNELIPWNVRMNELQGIQQSAYDMVVGGINTLAASGANMSGGGSTYDTPSSSLTNTQSSGAQYQYLGVQYDPNQYQNNIPMDNSMMSGEQGQAVNLGSGFNWSY